MRGERKDHTLPTTLELGYSQHFEYPTGRDVDTGDLLIPSSRSVGFFSYPVYALSPEGTVTTWNMSSGGAIPNYGGSQEIATGDILYMSGSYLYRVAEGRAPARPAAHAGESRCRAGGGC